MPLSHSAEGCDGPKLRMLFALSGGDLVNCVSLRLTSPKELALPYKEGYFRPIIFISQV